MRVFKRIDVVVKVIVAVAAAYLWLNVSGIRLAGDSTRRIGVLNHHGHILLGSRGSHGFGSASCGHQFTAMHITTTTLPPLCLKPRRKSEHFGVAETTDEETANEKGASQKAIFLSTVEKARTVIHVARSGALCTWFTSDMDDHLEGGYPFGVHVDYMLDDMGWPVFLLDSASQHSKNIESNPRAAVVCCTPCSDRQRSAASLSRVTLVGSVIPLEDENDIVKFKAFFQVAYSHAPKIVNNPMFRFMKLKPVKVYYTSGYGMVRKWLSVEEYEKAKPDMIVNDATQIIQSVNASKKKELLLVCKHLVGRNCTDVVMTNVDRLGADFSVQTGDETDEFRIGFDIDILGAEDAKSEIAKLFQDAWEIEHGYGCHDERPPIEQHAKVGGLATMSCREGK